MGKGVALNRNTYKKMMANGSVTFVVDDNDRQYCYVATRDRFTFQLREGKEFTPTYAADIDMQKGDPIQNIFNHHKTHPKLPSPPDVIKLKRAWKKAVKQRFLRNNWARK